MEFSALSAKRFVKQVTLGTSKSKYSYIGMQEELEQKLIYAPWRTSTVNISEVTCTVNSVTKTDGHFTTYIDDRYDAFKQAGDGVVDTGNMCGYAGCAAYRFELPSDFRSSGSSDTKLTSVRLPFSVDLYQRSGLRVALEFTDRSTPSDTWDVVRGDVDGAIRTQSIAPEPSVVGVRSWGFLGKRTVPCVSESVTSYGVVEFTSEQLASVSPVRYMYVYVTLEDYQDRWDMYTQTEPRQFYIEGSAMMVHAASSVGFTSDVSPDPSADGEFPIMRGGVAAYLSPDDTGSQMYQVSVDRTGRPLTGSAVDRIVEEIVKAGGIVKDIVMSPTYSVSYRKSDLLYTGQCFKFLAICGSGFAGTVENIPGLLLVDVYTGKPIYTTGRVEYANVPSGSSISGCVFTYDGLPWTYPTSQGNSDGFKFGSAARTARWVRTQIDSMGAYSQTYEFDLCFVPLYDDPNSSLRHRPVVVNPDPRGVCITFPFAVYGTGDSSTSGPFILQRSSSASEAAEWAVVSEYTSVSGYGYLLNQILCNQGVIDDVSPIAIPCVVTPERVLPIHPDTSGRAVLEDHKGYLAQVYGEGARESTEGGDVTREGLTAYGVRVVALSGGARISTLVEVEPKATARIRRLIPIETCSNDSFEVPNPIGKFAVVGDFTSVGGVACSHVAVVEVGYSDGEEAWGVLQTSVSPASFDASFPTALADGWSLNRLAPCISGQPSATSGGKLYAWKFYSDNAPGAISVTLQATVGDEILEADNPWVLAGSVAREDGQTATVPLRWNSLTGVWDNMVPVLPESTRNLVAYRLNSSAGLTGVRYASSLSAGGARSWYYRPIGVDATSIEYYKSPIGFRAMLARLYSGLAVPVANLASRLGAGICVSDSIVCDVAGAPSAVPGWQMTLCALVIPFSCPIEFTARRLRLRWGSGPDTIDPQHGRLNVWLKRGSYDVNHDPAVFSQASVWTGRGALKGYELLGNANFPVVGEFGHKIFIDFDIPGGLETDLATVVLTMWMDLDERKILEGDPSHPDYGDPDRPWGDANMPVSLYDGTVPENTNGFKPDVVLLR